VKIYTRTGDQGETSVLSGGRLPKSDVRLHALGDVDELNAIIGVTRAHLPDGLAEDDCNKLDEVLEQLQRMLFDLGCQLALPGGGSKFPTITDETAGMMEDIIDEYEAQLPPLTAFILPGGGLIGAGLHHARTVCRRAERWVVAMSQEAPVDDCLLEVVNRLSDLLFVLARWAAHRSGAEEVLWHPSRAGRD
jgi:cob(I)alamin adenosyltransferase